MVLLSAVLPPAPRLVWNASASAPVGLYSVEPGAMLEPGEMAIARVPQRYRHLAASRRYLPLNVPLVKRVAAYAGDETDGKIAHLDGLNLSRAWCWRAIAARLGPDHPLHDRAQGAALIHLDAALPHLASDYMGEHWLATFALLALEA